MISMEDEKYSNLLFLFFDGIPLIGSRKVQMNREVYGNMDRRCR